MKIFAPDYYEKFRCIAGDCRHSCCIGWEIDIDEDTLNLYKAVPGRFGARLLAHIGEEGGTAHFVLGADERCPFLNRNGLCDIYTELGEDALCQICTDHPRFRNFFEGRTEIGLGLCCEAAARLILEQETPARLVAIKDGEEWLSEEDAACLRARDGIFALLQNRSLPMEERLRLLQTEYDISFIPESTIAWADAFLTLDYMDNALPRLFHSLKEEKIDFYAPVAEDIAFEQLAVYFIYRHFKDFWDDCEESLAVGFMLISIRMLYALYRICEPETLPELARLYSAEIEYNEDNIEALTAYIQDVL